MSEFVARCRFILAILVCWSLFAACGGGGGGGTPAPQEPVSGDSVWAIDPDFVIDGGPGPDGIPALENPEFGAILDNEPLDPAGLVVAIRVGDQVKVYPHDILDYHEIVNDEIPDNPVILSYCPLTGSAIAWKGDPTHANPTFGVSGLLYNSNLLPYDRETGSLWSQMLELSVNGNRVLERPERLQVIESTWGTIAGMYPDAVQMTRNTGHDRDYDDYPYGSFKQDAGLLFPVLNVDNRMHPKTRVIGIRFNAGQSRVYQLGAFGSTTQVINDQFFDQAIVVFGNSSRNIAAIYRRELEDGTILNFAPSSDALPVVMTDDEGNSWDVFGEAVSGPRTGTQLATTSSYTAYWFAWVAHFVNTEIYFN
jgi:Protein of unknown function (DUF3179)